MKTCRMDIVLNRRLAQGGAKRFEFMEKPEDPPLAVGFGFFLKNKLLSGDALKSKKRLPSSLFYYRELQNLRDPLHFPGPGHPG